MRLNDLRDLCALVTHIARLFCFIFQISLNVGSTAGAGTKGARKTANIVIVFSDSHEVCSSNVHSVQNLRSSIWCCSGGIYGQQEYCQQKSEGKKLFEKCPDNDGNFWLIKTL